MDDTSTETCRYGDKRRKTELQKPSHKAISQSVSWNWEIWLGMKFFLLYFVVFFPFGWEAEFISGHDSQWSGTANVFMNVIPTTCPRGPDWGYIWSHWHPGEPLLGHTLFNSSAPNLVSSVTPFRYRSFGNRGTWIWLLLRVSITRLCSVSWIYIGSNMRSETHICTEKGQLQVPWIGTLNKMLRTQWGKRTRVIGMKFNQSKISK